MGFYCSKKERVMSGENKLYSRKFFVLNLVLVGIVIGFALAFVGFSWSSKSGKHSLFAEAPAQSSQNLPPEVSQALSQATNVQSAFRYVASTVMPSVVEIDVVETAQGGDSADNQNPWRFFFGQPDDGQGPSAPNKEEGLGSGIIVKRDGNTVYVLTNNHVAGSADKITVILSDGREYKASLVGVDKRKDIAVIKFETQDKDISIAKLGDSSSLQVGDWAIAVGNPFGFTSSVTIGVVSALGRSGGPDDNISDFIQTDAAINKGNSGGALVNIKGEVVGMNTWIASPSGASVGLGFAIPINRAKKAIDDIIGKGKVEYGWMGIQMMELDKAGAADLGVDAKKGAFVAQVFVGSPASKGGFLPGDVIVAANGQDIKASDEIVRLVSDIPAGTRLSFDVMRNGKRMGLSVLIEARNDTVASNDGNLFPGMGLISLKSDSLNADKLPKGAKGVYVASVFSKTPAAIIGLKPNDIITEVNDKPISSLQEFYARLNDPAEKKVTFTVLRDGEKVSTLAYVKK
jgi:Do/DeqQ family serine protease